MPRGDASAARVAEAALELFSRHGVAGTSLQMIADHLGVSKAAVYHRFRTKELIVEAVLAPAFSDIAGLVGDLEGRSARDGQRFLVASLAARAVAERDRYAVLLQDVTAAQIRRASREHLAVFRCLRDALAGEPVSATGRVRATAVLAGMVGPLVDPDLADVGAVQLEAALVDAGTRALGL